MSKIVIFVKYGCHNVKAAKNICEALKHTK
jgi:hypothetical protein